MNFTKKTFLIVLAFFAIYVIWGSTYLLNKIAVSQIAPFYLASIRFTIAGAMLLVISSVLGYTKGIRKKEILNSIIAGFLFLTYGNGVFVWALKYVDSGFASLLVAIQPLVILVLMNLMYRQRIQIKSIIGISLGILGIAILVTEKGVRYTSGSLIGILMIFTCILSWSFASIFVSKRSFPQKSLLDTGIQMLTGGLFLLLASFLFGETHLPFSQWTPKVTLSMYLLTFFGSIVAFTAFNYLLRSVSPEKVATSGYVNPVIAVVLGWYILDETISFQLLIAAFILLVGVYFINSSKSSV
ncbi:EamA family transporter [Aquimarina agarilytica]|uniref:EamA family transporter n=1 Tax=Aquimarina agarilytica TaxID=1087449 RepID=UPI000289A7BD|nr:EamA family transporter [Aquimarina agarilytica]